MLWYHRGEMMRWSWLAEPPIGRPIRWTKLLTCLCQLQHLSDGSVQGTYFMTNIGSLWGLSFWWRVKRQAMCWGASSAWCRRVWQQWLSWWCKKSVKHRWIIPRGLVCFNHAYQCESLSMGLGFGLHVPNPVFRMEYAFGHKLLIGWCSVIKLITLGKTEATNDIERRKVHTNARNVEQVERLTGWGVITGTRDTFGQVSWKILL